MTLSDYHQRKAERAKSYQAQHGLKLVRCTACNGSGRYDHNGSPPCGACDGTGRQREGARRPPPSSTAA